MKTKDNFGVQNKNNMENDDQDTWVEVIESLRKTEREKSGQNQEISCNIVKDNNRKKKINELV